MSDTKTVTVDTDIPSLYSRYSDQTSPQPVYVSLDTRDGKLSVDWSAVVGSGVPSEVFHHIIERWDVPALKDAAALALLREIEPVAQRLLDGDDEADAEIVEICEAAHADESGHLVAWDAGEYLDADQPTVAADATDADLATMAREIRADAAHDGIDWVDGLDEYLDGLRRETRGE